MTYRLPRLMLLALAGAALLGSSARAEIDPATLSFLEDQVGKGLYPGVMVALVEGDAVTYRGFGVADKATGTPPTADTVFETGSITKTFTALLLADMAEAGTVHLDDPVQTYLPEGVTMPRLGDRPMTLADIAEQHSGLPRLPADFNPADPLDPYADYDEAKLWASVNGLTLTARPGERYEYSNFGFGLLGTLLARAAGQPYGTLLRDNILEPLGMTATTLDVPPAMAQGYTEAGTPTPPWTFDALAGAGAVKSTARDMVKYLHAVMGEAGPDTLRAAASQVLQPRADTGLGGMRVGLAWMTMPRGDGRWHDGGTYGFRSFVGVDPQTQRAVVIWTNVLGRTNAIDRIGMHLLNPEIPLPARRPAKTEHRQAAMAADEMAAYVGRYRMDFGPTLTLRLAGDQMLAQLSGQPEVPVYPEGPGRFFYKVVDAQLEFSRDGSGAVSGVTIHQNGMDYRGRKE